MFFWLLLCQDYFNTIATAENETPVEQKFLVKISLTLW